MDVSKSNPHPLYDAVKSWKEAHKLANLMRVKVKNIKKNATDMAKEMDEVIEYSKQLYALLPKTDGTMFGTSPLAPSFLMEQLMVHIFRTEGKELNFAKRITRKSMIDFGKPFDFIEQFEGALGWAFKKEAEDKKVDLEKIV